MDYIVKNFDYLQHCDYSLVSRFFDNNASKIQLFYSIGLLYSEDEDFKYYAEWMILKSTAQEELYESILSFFKKYPTKIEGCYDLAHKLTDKSKFIEILWKLATVPKPQDRSYFYFSEELYDWKILDDLVIQCYYSGMYEDSYRAWNILMAKDDVQYPNEQCRLRCVDNGRYAKIILDSKNSYKLFREDIDNISYPESTDSKIPKIFHFIYIKGGYNFCMAHYVAIRSCYEVNKPEKIYLYTNTDLVDNEWWELAKKYCEVKQVRIPEYINNHHIRYKQHQADVMRVYILQKAGGVYMDLDVLSLKPLDGTVAVPDIETQGDTNLYNNDFVMPRESINRLCNCFIMSSKNHKMLDLWLDSYEKSYGEVEDYWGGLSVIKPLELIEKNNLKVTILRGKSIIPFTFNDYEFFYRDITDKISDSLTVHLWDTEAMKYNMIPLDLKYFDTNNNTFTRHFEKYVK
jgi:hypothetical protein